MSYLYALNVGWWYKFDIFTLSNIDKGNSSIKIDEITRLARIDGGLTLFEYKITSISSITTGKYDSIINEEIH